MNISGSVEFDAATPSNTQIAGAMAKQLGCSENVIVMKQIRTGFSTRKAEVKCIVYDDEAALERVEKLTKHIRKQRADAAKKATEAESERKEAEEKAKAEAATAKEAEAASEEKSEDAPAASEETKEEGSA